MCVKLGLLKQVKQFAPEGVVEPTFLRIKFHMSNLPDIQLYRGNMFILLLFIMVINKIHQTTIIKN